MIKNVQRQIPKRLIMIKSVLKKETKPLNPVGTPPYTHTHVPTPIHTSRYTPVGCTPRVRENDPCSTHGQQAQHLVLFNFFNINLNTPTTHKVNDEYMLMVMFIPKLYFN